MEGAARADAEAAPLLVEHNTRKTAIAEDDIDAVGCCELLRMARGEARVIAASLVAQVLQTTGELAPPILAAAVVDALSAAEHRADLPSRPLPAQWICDIGRCDTEPHLTATMIVGFLVLSLATALVTAAASISKRVAGANMLARVRGELFGAVLRQETAFFDATRSGELLSRITNDLDVVGNLLTYELANRVGSVFRLLGASIYIFGLSWRLSLVMYAAVPVASLIGKLSGNLFESLAARTQAALAAATEVATESFTAVRTVKTFAQESARGALFRGRVEEMRRCGVHMAYGRGWVRGATTLLEACSQAAVLYVGAMEVRQGLISTGELAAFILYALKIGQDLQDCFGLYGSVREALGSTRRVMALIKRAPRPPVRGDITIPDGAARGHVRLEDVHFAYRGRDGVPVLRGVSLDLAPGVVTAIVGRSGAGKSSIAALAAGLYEPDAGTITLDGIDLRKLNAAWLHERGVAVVGQEPVLLSGTISSSIAFGRPGAAQTDIETAARAANAHKFITALPDGYGTDVGEAGALLSGGQKQRVAIARALLMQPAVLVLDEATSALDAESERLVTGALRELMRGRTVLLIAHRLSTVRDAARIVVLDGGAVVEDGTHDALLARGGLYKHLARTQLSGPGPQ